MWAKRQVQHAEESTSYHEDGAVISDLSSWEACESLYHLLYVDEAYSVVIDLALPLPLGRARQPAVM